MTIEQAAAAPGTTQTPAAAAAPAATPTPATTPPADSSLLGDGVVAKPATSDAKPAADTKAPVADDKAPKSDAAAALTGAPDKYDFKFADGMDLPAAVVTEFSVVAKELGLSQDAAQKIMGTLAPKMAEANIAAIESYRADLIKQSKADKEIGGEKLTENLAVAKKAIDTFGTPELRALLNQSGMGDHPEVIRAFYKIGLAISEDKFVQGGKAPTKSEKSAATKLYGK